MPENMQISMTFSVNDNASAAIKKMADSMKQVEAQYDRLNGKFQKGFGMGPGGDINRGPGSTGSTYGGGNRGGGGRGGDAKVLLSEEEQYQRYLEKRIKLLERNKRAEEDLIALGLKRSKQEIKAEQDAQRARASAGPPQSWGAWVGNRLGISPSLGAGGMATAGALFAGHQLEKMGEVAHVMQSSYMPASMQNRRIFETLMPFGERMVNFGRNMSGEKTRMEEYSGVEHPIHMAMMRGDLMRANIDTVYGARYAQVNSQAAAMAGLKIPDMPGGMNRMTGTGEITYQNEKQLLGLRQNLAKTQAQITASKMQEAAATDRVMRADKEIGMLQKQSRAQARRIDNAKVDGTDIETINRWVHDAELTRERLTGWMGERHTRREQLVGIREQTAGLEHQARGLGIGIQEAQVGQLEEKYARRMSRVERYGAAGPVGRMMGEQVAQMVKGGARLSDLPPEFAQHLAAIEPELYRKQLQREEGGIGELGRVQRMFPQDIENQTGAEIQKAIENARTNVSVSIGLDAKQLADAVADSVKGVLGENYKEVLKDVKIQVEKEINKVTQGFIKGQIR